MKPSVVVAIALSSCATVPYQPGRAELPPVMPEDAFQRVTDVMRMDFPELQEADPSRFLLRSDWCPREERGVAAQARLTMWREEDELLAVVEVRYLVRRLFGLPEWGSVRAHPVWERASLDRAIAVLR